MNRFFPEIRKNFGFGLMRLPMLGEDVDIPQVSAMADAFLAAGFNYFDTARPYIQGKSELAFRECVAKRYPRSSFVLTNKLSNWCFEKEADIVPLFHSQLEACGVEYFDFYLHHALSAARHEKYTATRAYDIVKDLKAQGKIRHIGMSFHDSAQVLDRILTDRPEIEVVQLQFNYVDMLDPIVQSQACYEVCQKHGRPVIVMEPVRGGALVNLPERITRQMTACSPAGYALRFAAGFENIMMVLSGMSSMAQMEDNLSSMGDFRPLSPEEAELIGQARTAYQAMHKIPCTACRYCTDDCPAGIPIPDLFACFNDKKQEKPEADEAYASFAVKADACLRCGLCETVCPQHLQIRQLLADVHTAF